MLALACKFVVVCMVTYAAQLEVHFASCTFVCV